MKVGAVILAAGQGARFGTDVPKQFVALNGTPIVELAAQPFLDHPAIHDLVVVVPEGHTISWARSITGGATRRESSYRGVKALSESCTHVLIHDAARPLVSDDIINRCIESFELFDACDVTIPSADTIVKLASKHEVEQVLPRSELALGQTPQGFNRKQLLFAHEETPTDAAFTDDIGLFWAVYPRARVANVLGSERNMKVTTQADLLKAERLAREVPSTLYLPAPGTALIYGGTGGIGSCVAELLPAALIWGRDDCPLEGGHAQINTLPPLQYLVIATGSLKQIPGDQQDLSGGWIGDPWKDQFDLNFTHVRRFLINLKLEGVMLPGGSIVVVGSSSVYQGRPNYTAYSSAKAALMNFVQGFAGEWTDVRLNVVNPGRTATPMRAMMFPDEDQGRLAGPEVVARTIVRVLGENCTGSVFDVRANGIDT